MTTLFIILGVLATAAGAVLLAVKNLTEICGPNEALIFSGSKYRMGERVVGYRLLHGGRRLRVPLFERVDRIDLSNMIIEINVRGAYSKGGIPLNVEGVANVKVASTEPVIGNAIERFLGRGREEIMAVARENLEGNMRGVLATLTPEEVNEDRLKFAVSLLHEADDDLKRFGLCLDTLKIQHVSDDVGYLDSIGRRQSAELQMTSRVAEAENKAAAAERAAFNLEQREVARLDARIAVAKAEAERRINNAETRKGAAIAEAEGEVAARVAKANAELPMQKARIDKLRLELEADRINPARANRDAMIAKARGDAADIVEEGRARAASLREMVNTFDEAGDNARQIVVAQKLNALVDGLMTTVPAAPVGKLTVIDSGLNGGAGTDLVVSAVTANEKLKHALGIDVPAMLKAIAPSS